MADLLSALVDRCPEDPLQALEDIKPVLNDVRPDVRIMALNTLVRIAAIVEGIEDPKLSASALKLVNQLFSTRVADPDEDVRAFTVEGMAQIVKSGDQEAGKLVVPYLQDWRGGVRRSAIDLLGRLFIGGRAKGAILKPLLEKLEDQDTEVRHATIKALSAVTPKGDSTVVSALHQRVDAKHSKAISEEMHGLCCQALWQVAQPGDTDTVDVLIANLAQHKDGNVRLEAARGLGVIGNSTDRDFLASGGKDLVINALCRSLGRADELPQVYSPEMLEQVRREEEERQRKAEEDRKKKAEEERLRRLEEDSDDPFEVVDPEPVVEEVKEPEVQEPEIAEEVQEEEVVEEEPQKPAWQLEWEEEERLRREEEERNRLPSLEELFPVLVNRPLEEDQNGKRAQQLTPDEDAGVREEALRSVLKVAKKGDRLVLAAALLCLSDEEQKVRAEAFTVLTALHPSGADLSCSVCVMHVMVMGCEYYGEADARLFAIQYLIDRGQKGDEVIHGVISRQLFHARGSNFNQANAAERRLLLEALVTLAPGYERASVEEALLAGMEDVSAEVRVRSLELLPPFVDSKNRAAALEAVSVRLRDRDPDVKAAAAKTVATLGEPFSPMKTVKLSSTGQHLLVLKEAID